MSRPNVREKIAESALEQFHQRGLHACSVEDITKAAGVPKGSFYNHFGSKEELAAETVRRYRAASAWRGAAVDGLGPLATIRARFESVRDRMVATQFGRGCLLANFGGEVSDETPAVRAELTEAFAGWSGNVTTLIRAAQDAGEMQPGGDPDQLGRFLINAWEGAVTRAKVEKSAQPMDDFFLVAFTHLLH